VIGGEPNPRSKLMLLDGSL